MVRLPGIGRLRIPRRLTQRWRAQLRAQRRWWRTRLRRHPGAHDVLFPAAGGGVVAVETLAEGAGPRIAILHATAGTGHRSAAVAIARAMSAADPDATVRDVDTLVFASGFYRTTYTGGYDALQSRAPQLWGVLYHSWASAPVHRGAGPARLALDRLALRRLVRVVEREHPDAIVCTHFLPVEALSPRRGGGALRVPLYCVITDFVAHPFWAFPHVDRYFVASDRVAEQLQRWGVAPQRIEVTGIPVDPRFAQTIGRAEARQRFQLDADRPVVLMMGGGSGVGPLADLAARLSHLGSRPQVVVVCGTNERLREQIASLGIRSVRAIGVTHEIDVLLEACDVVVSKAGGLTCSEALIKRVPLVIHRPMPGQEVGNADYLVANGAAVHAGSPDEVEHAVARWLEDPAAREAARQAAGRIARPEAAATIARRVLEGVPQRGARTGT